MTNISAEEATIDVKFLYSTADFLNTHPDVESLLKESYERLLKFIDQNRFVPVSERLPEHGEKILVQSPNGHIESAVFDGQYFECDITGIENPRDFVSWRPINAGE